MHRKSFDLRPSFLAAPILALLAVPALAAEEALVLDGRVRGADGAAVAGAEVVLRPLLQPLEMGQRQLEGVEPETPVVTTRSAADGRFTFTAPHPAGWRVEVRHPDHATTSLVLRALVASRELPPLTLLPRSQVRVRVVDTSGEPLTGVPIVARGKPPRRESKSERVWWPATEQATTDAVGWATLAVPGDSRVVVIAVAGGRYFRRWLEPGSESVQRLDGRFDTYWLVDADDRPVGGVVGCYAAQVFALEGLADSDRRGFYTDPVLAFPAASAGDGRIGLPQDPGDESLRLIGRHGFYFKYQVERRTVDGEERAYLRLPALQRVDGRVFDPVAKRLVGGALVVANHSLGGDGMFFFGEGGAHMADGTGSFTLWTQRAPRPWLQVNAPGYLRTVIRPSAAGALVEVPLTPAAELFGRVADADGAGVGGVEIRERSWGTSSYMGPDRAIETVLTETTSREDGRFRLRALRPGASYELRIERSGFGSRKVTVPAGEFDRGEELEVVLVAGLRAVGRVLDLDERPIAGARATLVPATETTSFPYRYVPVAGTASDADGRFELGGLAPGTYYLRVAADGFAPRTTPGLELVTGSDAFDLGEVQLDRAVPRHDKNAQADESGVTGAAFVGEVRGLEPGELARLRIEARAHGVSKRGVVGPDGSYRIDRLSEGEWRITATVGSNERSRSVAGPISGHADQVRVDLDFGEGVAASGRVTIDGEPVGRSSVLATCSTSSARAMTDERGSFVLRDLEPGACALLLDLPPPANPLEVQVKVVEGVPLEVDLRSTVAGRVVGNDGQPVVGAKVHLIGSAGGLVLVGGSATAGADGSFAIHRISGPEPMLRVSAQGWAVTEIEIAGDAGAVEVVLEPAERLRLLIVHPSGHAPAVTVWATPAGVSLWRSVHHHRYVPDADGRIVVDTLGAGDWQLNVATGDAHYGLVQVQVPGPEVRVELRPEIPRELLLDPG